MTNPVAKIFCAIDTPDMLRAQEIAKALPPKDCGIKLGLEFFNSNGPQGITEMRRACPDLPLFLDLKFHDIPNTVAQAMRAATKLAPDYMTLHASGGVEMMQAARIAVEEEAARLNIPAPKILAVTILTSLDAGAISEIGYAGTIEDQVLKLSRLAQKSGLSGVVCSAKEIKTLRDQLGQNFVLMVPGIRPAGSETGDQKRVMTPEEAMKQGATHLVIGRPITEAQNPASTAREILAQLS